MVEPLPAVFTSAGETVTATAVATDEFTVSKYVIGVGVLLEPPPPHELRTAVATTVNTRIADRSSIETPPGVPVFLILQLPKGTAISSGVSRVLSERFQT